MASALPPDRIRFAAKAVSELPTRSVHRDAALGLWGPTLTSSALVMEFAQAAEESSMSPDEIAAALRSAVAVSEYMQKQSSIDILWTGPKSTSVPVRRIEQAICELIESAKHSLFIVSFVAYKAENVYNAIKAAIDRGVKVSFLTEASKENGGSLDVDPVEGLKKQFPEAVFYRWVNQESEGYSVVHAKCAVADECMALVTSANLTGAAMDNNMELGLLLKGEKVASRLAAHFTALITENVIKRV